jgi:hypothetical protein
LDQRNVVSKDFHDQSTAVSQMLNRTEIVISDQHNQTRALIVDVLRQVSKSASVVGYFTQIEAVPVATARRDELLITKTIETTILETLRFSTIGDRREAVPEAHRQTFRWILHDLGTDEKRPWDNFIHWLRYGNEIYWINGKAGSGKSTLMRYIYDNPITQQELSVWAEQTPLCVAGFFFWNSGTLEQRSQAGFLRTMLYEVLRQHPELIPSVLPWLWARLYSQAIRAPEIYNLEPITLPKLIKAFQKLVDQKTVPLKLCFFIDGLDEYDGDHKSIGTLFKQITTSVNVKVCVSSRPLLAFEDAFNNFPRLRLQDLTFSDIRNYVNDTLGMDPKYQRLLLIEMDLAPELVKEIVTKANGVFLWVVLVVKSLLDGLTNRDGIEDLQRRLRLLPSDLEALYRHMLFSRIDPFYHRKTSEIFQMVRAARKPSDSVEFKLEPELPTLLFLSMTVDENSERALTAKIHPMEARDISTRCQTMDDRLKCYCAGLLEVHVAPSSSVSGIDSESLKAEYKGGRVRYLHRTVRDYVEQPEIWHGLLSLTSDSDFSPYASLFWASVLYIKTVACTAKISRLLESVYTAISYAHHAEIATGKPRTRLLDELDRTLAHVLRKVVAECAQWPLLMPNYNILGDSDCTFLSLATQAGLALYVDEKLRGYGSTLRDGEVRALFAHALHPILGRFSISTKLISSLLLHGGKPNRRTSLLEGRSPWEKFLELVRSMRGMDLVNHGFGSAKSSSDYDDADMLGMLAISELLVQNGANPNAYMEEGNRKVTALAIVNSTFMIWAPSRALQLQQMLISAGAKVELSSIDKLREWGKEKKRRRARMSRHDWPPKG